jgi:D-glycero-alpha-D-manno-heptose-7-phosphate kinase
MDTWFAEHEYIFKIGVYPYAEVQIAVYDAAEVGDQIVINAENYGERYVLDPPSTHSAMVRTDAHHWKL